MFQLLVDIGFKEIEVGFPSASQTDFDFVRTLIEEDLVPADVTIQVLTQARAGSDRAHASSRCAARRARSCISTTRRRPCSASVCSSSTAPASATSRYSGARCVKACAREQPETEWTFEYSPESFTGTELEFAAEVVNAVIDVWQPAAARGDHQSAATVEMSTPNVYADHDRVDVRAHRAARARHVSACTRTTIAAAAWRRPSSALLAGADRIEGTLLGNGERTGNMDLVTMAMNLYSQGIDPELDLSDMRRIIETVEHCTEIETHPRHAYAGDLVYTAFRAATRTRSASRSRSSATTSRGRSRICRSTRTISGAATRRSCASTANPARAASLHVLERDFGITLPRWLQIAFSKVVQAKPSAIGGEISARAIRAAVRARIPRTAAARVCRITTSRAGDRVRVRADVGGALLEGEG